MTPQPQPPQQQQSKTVLGVVLLVLFGGLSCCGAFMALGAYGAYQEQKAKHVGIPVLDAGSDEEPEADPDSDETADVDDSSGVDDQALKDEFAGELLAELDDTGHPGYTLDAKKFRLTSDAGAQVSLTNLFDEYKNTDEDERLEYVKHAAQSLFPSDIPETWNAAKAQVLVTVRERIFVELLTVRSGKDAELAMTPLTDDLVQVAVYDGPNAMLYLTKKHLEDWGVSADEVFLEGRKQLVARSKKPFANPSPGVYESQWADNHDVARALLIETIRKLKVKGDPILFIPQRDHLVITGSDDKKGQAAAADLVDEYLALPRANTGRGWKLNKDGSFESWEPAPRSHFGELRQQAIASDANDQKKALDEKFENAGTDIFVGTTLFTEDDDGNPLTYAVWTKGADTLMPKADFIVLVDVDRPEADRVIGAAPWETVVKIAGSKMKADASYWPLRYRLKTFPDAKMVKAIGLHHFFTRNKAGAAKDDDEDAEDSDGD